MMRVFYRFIVCYGLDRFMVFVILFFGCIVSLIYWRMCVSDLFLNDM